jgi:hypothetical protein
MVSLLPFTSGGSKKEGGLRSRHRGSSGTNGGGGGGGGITSRLATLGGGGGGGSKGTLAPGRSIPNTILPTVQVRHDMVLGQDFHSQRCFCVSLSEPCLSDLMLID